jgi:hypothetical protein
MSELESMLGFTAQDKARWLEVNGKYYADPEQGWADKLLMHAAPKRSAAVYVMPAYQSPISGRWIDTPSQRRDDLRRNGSRPWEGMAVEKQEAARQTAYLEQSQEKALDHAVRETWQHLPDSKKAALLAA